MSNNYRDEQSSGESYRISGTDKRVFRCDGYYQEAMQQHSLLCYGGIMSKRFKLYNVNIKYIRNLHNVDDNVPSVSPQIGKQGRPFLGIVVLLNGSKFCIPFTSNSGKKSCVSRSLTGASPIRLRLNDWQMNYIVSIHLMSHLEKERFALISGTRERM